MKQYELSGRVVVITGSTGGLGHALAKALRAKGAKLALFDLNLDAATKQASELGPLNLARGWQVDVCSLENLESAFASAAAHFGGVDVVVANAGIGVLGPLANLDPKLMERHTDVNLNGVWRTFRAALPHVRTRHGYMMAISSMAAFVHNPLNGIYAATKAGVWALCDSVRVELRHLGVGVGSVHPTFFKTPMVDALLADPAGHKIFNGNTGLWKCIELEEVVAGVVKGIERRSDMVVVPRHLTLIARMPGMFRRIVDAIGYGRGRVEESIRLSASRSGR